MKWFRVYVISLIAMLAALCLLAGGAFDRCFTDECRAEEVARAAKDVAERQPHVIAEADGCKVYAFKVYEGPGGWKFFTRCPASTTTTQSTWHEPRRINCGKACFRTEYTRHEDVIRTEP